MTDDAWIWLLIIVIVGYLALGALAAAEAPHSRWARSRAGRALAWLLIGGDR